jgi:EAL domain
MERLTIEITETATTDDLDQTITFVDTLKELGCRVAIDDFGADGSATPRASRCLSKSESPAFRDITSVSPVLATDFQHDAAT